MLNDPMIQSVDFESDGGIAITYLIPADDVKANGVHHVHTLRIPAGDDYDDEIETILEAARYAVRDVREDLDKLPALQPQPSQDPPFAP